MIAENTDKTTWKFAEWAIMWKCKLLFVNGYEDKKPIYVAMEIRISMLGWKMLVRWNKEYTGWFFRY